MSETYRCGDYEALVEYLYDECEPGTRAAVAAHVASCDSCAEELEALGGTRRTLAAWTPPDVRLGFQVTPRAADGADARGSGGARVLRPAWWWQRPLPAWAQMAAAIAIFASGLA
ncbi:MAG TPA: zf-HC2 domain-containing protein, partial [Vicinamibacterales bacterium]|nr:zf-HC2 domain-containing protein [Vicinamibacterales bacterium]